MVEIIHKNVPVIMDYDKSAKMNTVVIGAKIGSRNENSKNTGISHFLEHMAFKGTKTRTYDQISREIESLGGLSNACTGNEYTLYYISALPEYTHKIIEILIDILSNSVYDQEQIDLEKGVIFQEINYYNDDPGSIASDKLLANIFKNNSLEQPILGEKEVLNTFTTDTFKDFIKTHYNKHNIAISIYGNFDKKAVLDQLEPYTSNLPDGPKSYFPPVQETYNHQSYVERDFAQNTIIMSYITEGYKDTKAHITRKLFSIILGSGMSSRLFINVREKQGLAYSIYSSIRPWDGIGILNIVSSTDNDKIENLYKSVQEECKKVFTDAIDDAEVQKAKNLMKSSLILSNNNITNKASQNILSYFFYDKIYTQDHTFSLIDSITREEIAKAGLKILEQKPSFCVVGKNAEKLKL